MGDASGQPIVMVRCAVEFQVFIAYLGFLMHNPFPILFKL